MEHPCWAITCAKMPLPATGLEVPGRAQFFGFAPRGFKRAGGQGRTPSQGCRSRSPARPLLAMDVNLNLAADAAAARPAAAAGGSPAQFARSA